MELTVITGLTTSHDGVSMPELDSQQVKREHGDNVLATFKRVFKFDPPRGEASHSTGPLLK
jgi:hypothetical protein